MTTLILEAYAHGGYNEGPAWAKWELTDERLERLELLSAICAKNELHSVTTRDPVDEWHNEDELRLRGDELHVSGSSLWFSCYPKHADYECETRIMELSDLQKLMRGEPVDEFIVEGDLVFQNETVKEGYTEHLADQTQEQD